MSSSLNLSFVECAPIPTPHTKRAMPDPQPHATMWRAGTHGSPSRTPYMSPLRTIRELSRERLRHGPGHSGVWGKLTKLPRKSDLSCIDMCTCPCYSTLAQANTRMVYPAILTITARATSDFCTYRKRLLRVAPCVCFWSIWMFELFPELSHICQNINLKRKMSWQTGKRQPDKRMDRQKECSSTPEIDIQGTGQSCIFYW